MLKKTVSVSDWSNSKMDKVLIIAEAGVNHNGDINMAKKLIKTAKEAGVDIVKFQTFDAAKLVSRFAPMAEYQKKNTGKDEFQKDMLEKLQLSKEEFIELAAYCKKIGIRFLSTAFDIESVRFLDPLQDIWKIPSGEITNYPYLVEIAKTGKPVIMSTGMATIDEVRQAVDTLKEFGTTDITILHCTTNYPTPIEEANLNEMNTLRDEFKVPVGYSDHTKGIKVSLVAAAMGACVIEKHFTLDRELPGPDHKASLEPDELKELVLGVREIELIRGKSEKCPTESELKNRLVARKSIVAARDIKKGEVLSEENITTKRPGNGVSAMKWKEVIGTKAVRDFSEDELIEL